METKGLLILLLAASIFYLTAAGIVCDDNGRQNSCTSAEAYAVAVGAVSLFVVLALLVLDIVKGVKDIIHQISSVFLFIWWLIGACYGTFDSPFFSPGGNANGYFSAWLGLCCATYYMFSSVSQVKKNVDKIFQSSLSNIGMVFGAQLIYTVAAAILVDNWQGNDTYSNYALAAGVIGVFITLFMILLKVVDDKKFGKFGSFLSAFLLLWWIIAFGITTFKGPFTGLSNGYFAAWASLIATAWLFMSFSDSDSGASMFNVSAINFGKNTKVENDKPEKKDTETKA